MLRTSVMPAAQRNGRWIGRVGAVVMVLTLALSLLGTATPTLAAEPLCFNQPGVRACIAPEFRDYWQRNGGLSVFGYPVTTAKEEKTPEGTFLVQYFERQRLEWHPNVAAPYTVQLGRVNDEVLVREGRSWRSFPKAQATADCVMFQETGHAVCGDFLAQWRSKGLDLGDPGVSWRESMALWGLPLSQPQVEMNIDGDQPLTQHFERARMELHGASGKGSGQMLLTRVGLALVPMNLKILSINDFHGQISTGRRLDNKDVGGAAILAAYLNQRRAQAEYSLLVHAGDMIGASGPSSALAQDEPTMDFLNRMKFDVGTVGNHEFDEGLDELMRLYKGGCHPKTGCWGGTNFPTLAANVIDNRTGKTILPPYHIINKDGARIGFIGVVLESTPEIVVPSAVANLKFLDEATTINKYVPELQAQGVHAIVVLIHEGGTQNTQTGAVSGAIVPIVQAMDKDVDIVITGHSHSFINATINGKLVIQALSYSMAFAEVDVVIDRAKRDIVSFKGTVVNTYHEGMTPDPAIATMVKSYEDKVAPLVNRRLNTLSERLPNESNAAGESAIGNLIADAQRTTMGTQFAFMNPGGIRAPIEAGDVTWGELYAVQPFANDLVKMTLKGDQIYTLLNQQWQPQADGTIRTRFLQISGLSYTWDNARAVGNKVVEVRGADGKAIDRNASYSLTVNIFLAGGGDAFTVLRDGTNREVGPVDLDALVTYIEKLPQPFTYKIEGRIVRQ